MNILIFHVITLISHYMEDFKDLFNLNHKNLMLIYEHILSTISNDSIENMCSEIIKHSKFIRKL